MKTTWLFSTKMGMTALPSIKLKGNPHDTKAEAMKHAQENGGRTDVYTLTAVCRFPDTKGEFAFDYWPDGRNIGDGKGRRV